MPKLGRLVLAVASLATLGCHGKYIRAVSDAPIERTPERLQRGAYLVNQVMLCPACHTTRDNGNIHLEPERTDAFLGGGNTYVDKGLGTLWIPNLTPDPETGLGAWKDDEVMRAIRDGVSRDGHFLIPLMPYFSYQHLSDEDARSVVAYLRSIPPYHQPKPRQENKLTLMQRLLFKTVGVQMHRPVADVAAPPRSDTLAYGHYLVRIGACSECHSLTEKGPRPETDPLYLAGSDQAFDDPGLGQTYPRNLTPDSETGLGNYDATSIKQALRNGRRLDGKRMAPPMSVVIPHISGLAEDDMDALVAYLKSLPAARNRVRDRNLSPELRKELGD
ncbi:MAG TPA: c-type cytochrome [Polyangia bacterium]|nr:c-type cytochrome [Polyangia bacterium]